MNHPDSPNPAPSDPSSPVNQPPQQPGAEAPQGQQPGHAPQPYGYDPVGGTHKRPGAAKSASVLGIVSGSLGIVSAVATCIVTANSQRDINELKGRIRPDLFEQVTNFLNGAYLVAAVTLIVAAILLVGGIQFLKGRGHSLLRAGAIAQIVVVVAELLLSLAASGALNTSTSPSALVRSAIGLGLAISILVNLSKPETKRWKDSVS